MVPIKKILYATDLSENSRQAFNYAVSLAEKYGATIVVLHVLELITTNMQFQISGYLGAEEWERLQRENEVRLVDDIKSKLLAFCRHPHPDSPAGCERDATILVRRGVAVETILKVAEEFHADLIVMGTHGYGLVQDALMGGTVRRVLRRSFKPVLVVPHPKRVKRA